AMNDDGAFFTARDRHDLAFALDQGQGVIKGRNLIERHDFFFIGEQDVDVVFHEVDEGGAVAVHAERIGQGQRYFAAVLVGDFGGFAEGGHRRFLVEQIAFQIGDGRIGNFGFNDIVRAQFHGGAQKGVHGARSVGRDQNHAASGG